MPTASRPTFPALLPDVLSCNHMLVTEGGLETHLIFLRSLELPNFCSFEAVTRPDWCPILVEVFKEYASLNPKSGKITLMIDTPTWRASTDHMKKVGRPGTEEDVVEVNTASVKMLQVLREEMEKEHGTSFLIGGSVGPRGDGYLVETVMSPTEAANYHHPQIQALADAGVDVVNAVTMNYINEAIGVAMAAVRAAIPCVISFTVETDGQLPDGASLAEAVRQVDDALKGSTPPAYYMVNCAHPTHVAPALSPSLQATRRVLGVRANASTKSHAELDECTELDDGDPVAFGLEMAALAKSAGLPVLGGCCGTDTRHIKHLIGHLI